MHAPQETSDCNRDAKGALHAAQGSAAVEPRYPLKCRRCGERNYLTDSLMCLCWNCGFPYPWVTTNVKLDGV